MQNNTLSPVLRSWSELIKYFDLEIEVEDDRSKIIPQHYVGRITGITLDKIQIRRNNNLSEWMPLNNSSVRFYPIVHNSNP